MSEMSKKELKEMRKIEEARRINLEKKASMTKWITIGIISTVFLGAFLFLVVFLRNNNPNLATPNSSAPVVLSDSGEFRIAPESTTPIKERPVTLVEFADVQCPACKQYNPIVNTLLGLYPETLAINFKHFPISSIHPNGVVSAMAAESAGVQGKFFEMLDLLYARQEAWSKLANPEDVFLEYAQELGLDEAKFKKDMKDESLTAKIEAQRTEGISAGVNSTPTFFINGVKIANPADISGFQTAIDSALAQIGGGNTIGDDVVSTPSAQDSLSPQINL